MRLLTSKLVDAFPELDEFPAPQRLAFLDRAIKRWWVIVLPFPIAGAAIVVALISIVSAARHIESLRDGQESAWMNGINWGTLFHLIILLIPLCVGGFVFLISRDLLCRRRISQIIRQRFHCSACRYKLAGLAVSHDNKATCPECGLVQQVDPSLRELAPIQTTT